MEQTKDQAVSQQVPEFKTIEISGGRKATMLAPDLNAKQKLAIISETMLKRLIALLPTAKFYEIKRQFSNTVLDTQNLDEMLDVAASELDFHTSVNRTKAFFVLQDPEPVVVASKVRLDDTFGGQQP